MDNKIFESENRYDEFLFGFVHEDITYCVFIIPQEPLPKSLLAYQKITEKQQLFAKALQLHTQTYGNLNGILLDYECMRFSTGSFQVEKVCEQLTHIFIAM